MDTRKYINISIVLVAISFFVVAIDTRAEAWIVDPGKYKYSATHMFIDKSSRKEKKIRQQTKYELELLEHILNSTKAKIISQHDSLSNSDQVMIRSINQDLEKIAAEKEKLSKAIDNSLSKFEVEYGVKDGNSVGAVIMHDIGKFDGQCYYGHSLEAYFKHQLWSNDNYVITIIPRLSTMDYNKYYNKNLIGSGLYIGKSGCNKKGHCHYREVGIGTAKTINKTIYKEDKIIFSIQEGYEFISGFSLSNFAEFEYIKTNKNNKDFNFFEQVSVAKSFNFANLGSNNFTLQLGYFWKGSFKNDFDTVSGPVISLWFTI